MKLVLVCVLVTSLVVLSCQADERQKKKYKACKKVKRMCKNGDKQSCTDYNKVTQYCCKPIGKKYKCCAEHIHDKLNCSGGVYIFGPDNCNCQKYYQCYSGTLNHFPCPVGGAWTNNSATPACLQLYDPKRLCGDRPFIPPKIVAKFIPITFIIRDSTVSPPVDLLSFSGVILQGPLYNIMLAFAAIRADFKFKTSFHDVFWEFLTCINGKCGAWIADKTYWSIKHNGESISVGISTFVPDDSEVILFNFVVG